MKNYALSLLVLGITASALAIGGGGGTFYNLDQQGGWNGYGMLPTAYNICSNCSPQVTWARQTGVRLPSLSGSSTRHDVGGTTQYADAFWNNKLIGDFSTQQTYMLRKGAQSDLEQR